jgi:hypothetical protein
LSDYDKCAFAKLYFSDLTPVIDEVNLKKEVDNFPNPFEYKTTIEFNVPEIEANVSIYLLNLLSERTIIFENQNYSCGNYSYNINLSNFSSGIYFIQIKIGESFILKKVVCNK